jgi:hypothetical protein
VDTVQKFCDQCGVEVPAGSRFCGLCGHQLGQPVEGLSSEPVVEEDSETLDSDALIPVEQMHEQQKVVKGRKKGEGIEVPWLFGPVVEEDSETLDSDALNPVKQMLEQQKAVKERKKGERIEVDWPFNREVEENSETLDSDALNPVERRLAQQKTTIDRFENGRWSKSEAIGKGMSKRDQRRKTKRELVARGKEARKKEKARKEEARKKEKARSNKLLEEFQKKRLNEAEAGWGHWERVPKVVCSHCGTEGSVSKYVIPTIDTLEDGIARMFSVGPTKGEMLGQEREALRKKKIPGMKCENCTVKWNV